MSDKSEEKETGSNASLPNIRELVKKFVPWDGHLAVRPILEGRTASGLIIPETARENAQVFICHVFAVGPGVKRTRVGDTVLVAGRANVRKVKWNTLSEEQDFILIEERGILGTLGDLPEGYQPETLVKSFREAMWEEEVEVSSLAPPVVVKPTIPGGFHH